jgi:Ca2+-binding RTX toxin-like protein
MTHHITTANSIDQATGDALTASGPDTLIIDDGAYLISETAGNGATLTGSWTVTVNGEIGGFGSSTNTVGLFLTSGSVTIGSTGIVSGVDPCIALQAAGALDLTNFGSIIGAGAAIVIGGKAEIQNAGVIVGTVDLGSGNDTFIDFVKVGNTIKTGTTTNEIRLGTGINKFLGGTHAETVRDDGGTDTVALGGGNDAYFGATRVPSIIVAGNDTLDGGKGVDTYDASGAEMQLRINLDATGHGGILAHSAHGSSIGSDRIVNFENAFGGQGNDIVFGSNGRNKLDGGAGNDHLYGLGGADVLTDYSGANTFHFLKLSDSGLTASTRDTIIGFGGVAYGDKIDLSAIDANSAATGNQAFHLSADGGLGAFTHHAGELRYQFTAGNNTLVLADTDGDGAPNMSILLRFHHLLTAGDFNL